MRPLRTRLEEARQRLGVPWHVLEWAYLLSWVLAGFGALLREKCAVRGVSFGGPDDFFEKRMLGYVERTWDQWLGPLVRPLPSFETVIGGLRPRVAEILSATE